MEMVDGTHLIDFALPVLVLRNHDAARDRRLRGAFEACNGIVEPQDTQRSPDAGVRRTPVVCVIDGTGQRARPADEQEVAVAFNPGFAMPGLAEPHADFLVARRLYGEAGDAPVRLESFI